MQQSKRYTNFNRLMVTLLFVLHSAIIFAYDGNSIEKNIPNL